MTGFIKVLEFYSGVGGMHFAIESLGGRAVIEKAYELNPTANNVYAINFPHTKLMQKNIEGLSLDDIESPHCDAWVMSPPCQPFTRQGKQNASDDPRTKSFINLVNILSVMKHPPSYILMENVKGFEVSDTRYMFVECLKSRNYGYQEFLVSPIDFGIPNSRLRYYLLAKLKNDFIFKCSETPIQFSTEKFVNCTCSELGGPQTKACPNCVLGQIIKKCKQKKIEDFLEPASRSLGEMEGFCLKKDILLRYHGVLDVVNPESTKSCCFTKAYGKYMEGTGSIFTTASTTRLKEVFECVKEARNETEKYQLLSSLQLRYFTPNEVSKLMCFPQNFVFPENTTLKQKYRLLGNSINVYVVGTLIASLLFTEI